MHGPTSPSTRWITTIPGLHGHAVFVDVPTSRVLVCDGWGVSFASLRLRALACDDGHELASVRLGNAVRALSVTPDGGLLAATDTKIFKLDRESLAETERWTSRIPRYTDELLVAGDFAHLATRSRAAVHAISLRDGATKRKEAGEFARFHALDEARFLIAAGAGRLSIAKAGLSGPLESIATTPPFCDSALDALGRAWLSLGAAREQIDERSVGPGAPTSRLAWLDLAHPSELKETDLGLPFWQLAVSRDGALLTVIGVTPAPKGPPRRTDVATFLTDDFEQVAWLRMPEGYQVLEVSPELGVGWATRQAGDASSELMCFTVGGGGRDPKRSFGQPLKTT